MKYLLINASFLWETGFLKKKSHFNFKSSLSHSEEGWHEILFRYLFVLMQLFKNNLENVSDLLWKLNFKQIIWLSIKIMQFLKVFLRKVLNGGKEELKVF